MCVCVCVCGLGRCPATFRCVHALASMKLSQIINFVCDVEQRNRTDFEVFMLTAKDGTEHHHPEQSRPTELVTQFGSFACAVYPADSWQGSMKSIALLMHLEWDLSLSLSL